MARIIGLSAKSRVRGMNCISIYASSHFSGKMVADGSSDGYKRKSSVLSCEAVSYVSSAYIPACLRQGGRPTLSNAHRAAECAESAGNIRDDLDEVITLNSVSVIVAEYIPFGSNQVCCPA